MAREIFRTPSLGLAIAIHALALCAILGYHPVRKQLSEVTPLVVRLLAPPAPKHVAPPKPRMTLRMPDAPKFPEVRLLPIAPAPIEARAPVTAPITPITVPAPTQIKSSVEPLAAITVTPPVFNANYLDNPAPSYPGLSKRFHEQGRVVLRVLVRANGTAAQVQVRTSSGFARLDDAARNAVLRWKFLPAKRGAEPIEEWVLIPVAFRLDS